MDKHDFFIIKNIKHVSRFQFKLLLNHTKKNLIHRIGLSLYCNTINFKSDLPCNKRFYAHPCTALICEARELETIKLNVYLFLFRRHRYHRSQKMSQKRQGFAFSPLSQKLIS